MAKETEIQTKFVNRVNETGGMAFKLSNQFILGVPDIYMKFPEIEPIITEMKVAKSIRSKISVTPLQYNFMSKLNKVGHTCMVLVYCRHEKIHMYQTILFSSFLSLEDINKHWYLHTDGETFEYKTFNDVAPYEIIKGTLV